MKRIIISLAILIAIFSRTFVLGQYKPKLVTQINVNKPAFATFIPNTKGDMHHIAISSFNGAPFSSDYVHFIANYSLNQPYNVQTLNNNGLVWPNELSYTQTSIIDPKIDANGGLFAPCGFLVPSKTDGSIIYYPFGPGGDRSTLLGPINLVNKSNQTNTWFYHRIRLVDMNGDGIKDMLTCRSHKPIIGSTLVELVAFVFDQKSQQFKEILIIKNICDVFFDVADLDNDGRFEIVAAGFFISNLYIIYSDDPNNSFTTNKIKTIQVDGNGGKFFDVKVDDLDNSGNLELLVTNHQGKSDQIKGSLYFYSLQGNNIRNATWLRNTIYDNFPVIHSGVQQAAPGAARSLTPLVNDTTSRKYILVSGDGSSSAYFFAPNSSGDLKYNLVWSKLYSGYTAGGLSIADLNNDGINEFIIAIYEANYLEIFTLENM